MPNFDFTMDENDIPGSLARLLKYMRWFSANIDETNIKYLAWGDSIADNVDATHKLKLKLYIPEGVKSVQKLTVNFSLEAFRAYETGASSSTSSSETSANGGASINQYSDFAHWYENGYDDSYFYPGGAAQTGSHTHNRHFSGHAHTYDDSGVTKTTDMSQVDLDVPTDSAGDHTHYVWLHSHNHYIDFNNLHAHDFTIPGHAHGINYGIYESTTATGVKVYIDGVLRLDNGGSDYTTDQADLDVTEWVNTSGWHTIELSSTQLGRINAAYFIQIYTGTNGL